jgi:hypothetical protein
MQYEKAASAAAQIVLQGHAAAEYRHIIESP